MNNHWKNKLAVQNLLFELTNFDLPSFSYSEQQWVNWAKI
jgi:hypothetical protein